MKGRGGIIPFSAASTIALTMVLRSCESVTQARSVICCIIVLSPSLAWGFCLLLSLCLLPFLGRDFFPAVDAGQIRLHVRAPQGTRIESTEQRFYEVGRAIRKTIPNREVDTVLDNIGLPNSGINLAFSDNATSSAADGEILVALNPENHGSTAGYVRSLRQSLPKQFPDMSFYFASPDIVSQILNFGLPAPIDIQVTGRDPGQLRRGDANTGAGVKVRGAVDVHVHQRVHGPDLWVNVDRTRAQQLGLTQQQVASTMLVSLSSSGQTSPELLAELPEWRQLPCRRPNPAIQHGHSPGSKEYACRCPRPRAAAIAR